MKQLILLLTLTALLFARPTVYIGEITSDDFDDATLNKINEVFIDVWSENAIYENLENIPRINTSHYVQQLNLSDSDKVVMGTIMELGGTHLLRVDVYNSAGVREHVSREPLGELGKIYSPMGRTRVDYYEPISDASLAMKSSSKHQMGWSITIGGGIKPHGFDYKTVDNGDTITHNPYSLALIDIALIDALGKFHDHQVTLLLHFNIRADMAIAFGYKKALAAKHPHSPTAGIEVGLNKMVISNYMGLENNNLLGENDGLTVTPKIGFLMFRDQKINLFTDLAYTWILSERKARYPSVRFGISSYWGKKFRN